MRCSSAQATASQCSTHCSHATQRSASLRRRRLQCKAKPPATSSTHESAARAAAATMGKGGMDYKGQKLSEQIYLVLIPAVGSVAWVFGYLLKTSKPPSTGGSPV